jgi:hypothetical protein
MGKKKTLAEKKDVTDNFYGPLADTARHKRRIDEMVSRGERIVKKKAKRHK